MDLVPRIFVGLANARLRCFGDKGDVEDITEGTLACFFPVVENPTTNQPAADIISTVEFDHTGNYLATGDKGGRVVLFERNETVPTSVSPVSCPTNRMSNCYPSLEKNLRI